MVLSLLKKYLYCNLDFEKDSIFLDGDNEINHDQKRIKYYEEKIDNNQKVPPVEVVLGINQEYVLERLKVSKLILLGRKPDSGDQIYIVANGYHRTIALKNKNKNLSVEIFGSMK